MPAYHINHPEFRAPRMVEAISPKSARAHVSKELLVTKLTTREVADLSRDGVELQTVAKRSG